MYTSIIFTLASCLIMASCHKKTASLQKVSILNNYPSGSGIINAGDSLYILGDDAPFLQITDTEFIPADTIKLVSSVTRRIDKRTKSDYEALTFNSIDNKGKLLMIGSGSVYPYRFNCMVMDIRTRQRSKISLDTFYNRLKKAGLSELNIEGAAAIPGGIVLANRGNYANPRNHLIFTSSDFWMRQNDAEFHIAGIGTHNPAQPFKGISGLEYSMYNDRLYVTLSTEETKNTYDDGEIGNSYIWVINDITSKRRFAGINFSYEINLAAIDKRLEKQKIESICIIRESKKYAEAILVSDDDQGGTVLFKINLVE